jgi:hypothetical protein
MQRESQNGYMNDLTSQLQSHEATEGNHFVHRLQADKHVIAVTIFAFLSLTFLFDNILRSNDSVYFPRAL